MANFTYTAIDSSGSRTSGEIEADNQSAAIRILDERSLYPVDIKERGERKQTSTGNARVKPGDVGLMYGQLGDLLGAGLPLLRALKTLAKTSAGSLSQVMKNVAEDVASGRELANSMDEHPHIFRPLHVAMIRSGEQAGFLEEVLANLAAFIERQDDLRGKVRGALIYPIMLTCLGIGAMSMALIVLVPNFKPMFEGMALPLPTRILFAASDFLVYNWHMAIGIAFLAIIGLWGLFSSEQGKIMWNLWQIRIPIFGSAIRMVSITRFCRILGTMLANGVPILQALTISRDAAGSILLEQGIDQAAENVRAGKALSEPLRSCGLFPEQVVEMIAVAEESNQLERVLVQIADTVERRTNRQVDQAIRLIEPMILVLLAAAIGFIAVGLLYPIFTMAQTLK